MVSESFNQNTEQVPSQSNGFEDFPPFDPEKAKQEYDKVREQMAEEELVAENKVGDNFGYSERAIKDIGSAAISEITQSKSL